MRNRLTILTLFVLILVVGTVSAFNFDNTMKFDKSENKLRIVNAMGLGSDIVTYKLIENKCEFWNCKAVLEVQINEKNKAFESFNFKGKDNKLKEIPYKVYLDGKEYDGKQLNVGTYTFEIKGTLNGESVDWGFSALGMSEDNIREYWAWWNAGFNYRTPININVGTEAVKQYYTVEVSEWDTSNSAIYNLTNPYSFEIVCNTTIVDRIIGNESDLLIDGVTKKYGNTNGWGQSNTTLIFMIPQNLSASTNYNEYCYVYYGNKSYNSTHTNKYNTSIFYEDFKRSNSATLDNSWIEDGTYSYLQINNNQAEVVGTNVGSAYTPFLNGNISDLEKYEISAGITWSGTAGNIFYLRISDTAGTYPSSAISGASGEFYSLKAESGLRTAVQKVDNNANIKLQSGVNTASVKYAMRWINLDRINRGDFIAYMNNSLVTFDNTNGTNTQASGKRGYVNILGERVGDKLDYVMIKRYMDVPPTATIGTEEVNSEVSINLIYPTDNLNLQTTNIFFNGLFTSENYDLNSATLYVWYNNYSLFALNSTYINGTSNSSNLSLSGFSIGNYYWNYFVTINNATGSTSSFASSNYSFSIGANISNLSYNSYVYETERQVIASTIKSIVGVPVSGAILNYSGSQYPASVVNLGNDDYYVYSSLDTPTLTGSSSFNFILNLGSFNQSTLTYTQEVLPINFSLCNTAFTYPYINYSFLDESTNEHINATITSASFNYFIGQGNSYKTYSFTNTTINPQYKFCFTPQNKTLYINYSSLKYSNGVDYPSRTSADNLTLTNTTLEKFLYLVNADSGIYVTFQVVNEVPQPITSTSVQVYKSDSLILTGSTDSAGSVTFFLDPNTEYTFIFSKIGYDSSTYTLTPSQSTYTITLASTTSSVEQTQSYMTGISYYINPNQTTLNNKTTYTFSFQISSSYWELDSYGFVLKNSSGAVLGSASGSSGTGGTVTALLNTNNNSRIYMQYYWSIDGNYSNGTQMWYINSYYAGKYSIVSLFTGLRRFNSSGNGFDDFGTALIGFLVILMVASFVSMQSLTGNSDIIIAGVIALTTLLLEIAGFFVNFYTFPYLNTVVTGLIFIIIMYEEWWR